MSVLISDLAYILIVAGFTTVIFKKLKQPLVLGYIVAGFLTGPYMPYTPTVGNMEECSQWGEIGVIVLMFSLGLEFSFKKIIQMGLSPIVCACMIMAGMMGLGNMTGSLFGWSAMDSMFLGGMLAMSSTTIIYKAYEDLGMRHKHFAANVLSVLIIEDILGILLMVVLSTIAATRKFEGMALIHSLMGLGSVLLLWFLVGISVLPIILKRYKKYMNRETLMIVSLAMCFLLVVVSSKAGYSPAFGAFMMGSILAETVEAEQIEKAVSPIKDLFGAIFFVSVGMMVNPSVLVEYWGIIMVLTLCIILGQMTIGSMSYLITGSSLVDSIHSGFSMVQIGEFAFILAVLGEQLGVTSSKLYPIVVAVSIITTFLTPYIIKLSTPAGKYILGGIDVHVSKSIISNISGKKHSIERRIGEMNIKNDVVLTWRALLKALCYQTVCYLVLSSAFVGFGIAVFDSLIGWYCVPVIIIFISPFLRAIVMRKNHSNEVKFLCRQGRAQRLLVASTIVVRFVLCLALVVTIFESTCVLPWYVDLSLSLAAMAVIMYSRSVKMVSIRIERTFKQNLKRRENESSTYSRMLRGQDLHITKIVVPELSKWAGKKLSMLNFGRHYNIHVAAIIRGNIRINIPDGESMVFPGDILEIVGDDVSIEKMQQKMYTETFTAQETEKSEPLTLRRYVMQEKSGLVGLSLAKSGIRQKYHCTVIGFEDKEGNIAPPQSDRIIVEKDVIWVIGEYESLKNLKTAAEQMRTNI